MKHVWPLIVFVAMVGCTENREPTLIDFERAILEKPISEKELFAPENEGLKYSLYKHFPMGIRNGFKGPIHSKKAFDQFISFDILTLGEWVIGDQRTYHGRLVQNAIKGPFDIEHTLFFSDPNTSISRYLIQNNSDSIQDLEVNWSVKVTDEMVFEEGRTYGIRLMIDNAEIWPHTSGIESFNFNSDSTELRKNVMVGQLLPQEITYVYSITTFITDQDSIQPMLRCRPWLLFPEEEYWENCEEYGENLLKEP